MERQRVYSDQMFLKEQFDLDLHSLHLCNFIILSDKSVYEILGHLLYMHLLLLQSIIIFYP